MGGKCGKRGLLRSTPLLLTPLSFHFLSLASATPGAPWRGAGTEVPPGDPRVPNSRSQGEQSPLLPADTQPRCFPQHRGLPVPSTAQPKDLHFKGILEWICTDVYLQVLFFFRLLPL